MFGAMQEQQWFMGREEGREDNVVCGQCVKGFSCLYCFVVLHSLVECGIGERLGSVVSVFILPKLSFLSLEGLEGVFVSSHN